jgi:hypothetical protein
VRATPKEPSAAPTTSRLALLTTSVAGLLAVVVAWIVVGSHGPLSALLGVGMVIGFFSASGLPFLFAREVGAGFAFLVLGMGYVLRILLGVVIYAVAVSSDAIDRQVVGLTVIGCALVWVNTQVVHGLSRRNQPTLDL